MDSVTLKGFFVKAVIWGLAYYFIRRGLNPEVAEVEKYKQDAIYGSIASFAAAILGWYAQQYVTNQG